MSDRRSALRRFLASRLDPTSYLGLHLTVGLAVALLALWGFGALLEEVLDGATLVRTDIAADAWLHAHATPLGTSSFHAITQLGSPALMTLVAGIGAAVLWRVRDRTPPMVAALGRAAVVTWIAAFVGGALLGQLLKTLVHRTRPEYGARFLHGVSYSFPSGHAMGATIGYGMIAWALIRLLGLRGTARALTIVACVLVVLAIGTSRLYLGVHYPSDVVGGFAVGGAWLTVCLTGLSVAEGRERVRQASGTPAYRKRS